MAIDQNLLPQDVRIGAVTPDPELSVSRLNDRQGLLKMVNSQRRLLDQVADARNLDDYQQQAFNLLSAPATGKAFDLAAEPAQVRDQRRAEEAGSALLVDHEVARQRRAS